MMPSPEDPADLELPPDRMRAMGEAVAGPADRPHRLARIDQPACGDVRRRGPVPGDARAAARARRGARGAARPAVRRLDPALVQPGRPRLPGLHPRRRHLPGGARRLDRRRHQPLHRRLAGRAGAGAARGQRARLAARLDGLPAHARAACSPPAARWPPSTPSSAPASGSSGRDPRAASSTPPTRPMPRSPSRPSWPASCPIGCGTVPVDERFRMRVDALGEAIDADRRAGLRPFLVVSTRRDDEHRRRRPAGCDRRRVRRARAVAPRRRGLRRLLPPGRVAAAAPGRAAARRLADARPAQGLFLPYGTGALLGPRRLGAARRPRSPAPATCRRRPMPKFYDPAQHGPELSRASRACGSG